MLAIIDARSPKIAIENLQKYADDILLFSSQNITYNSISGHPDIFIFQSKKGIVLAPNSPKNLIDFLQKHKINFHFGTSNIGSNLEESVRCNCIANEDFIFHKKGFTENVILELHEKEKFRNLPQAYVRCSMINLRNNVFVSSDMGIKKVLDKNGFKNLYFSPEKIKIIDHKNGFFGGTCGIYENKIFFNGNIKKHKDGEELYKLLSDMNYEIISLHDDFLYDGGGMFFL